MRKVGDKNGVEELPPYDLVHSQLHFSLGYIRIAFQWRDRLLGYMRPVEAKRDHQSWRSIRPLHGSSGGHGGAVDLDEAVCSWFALWVHEFGYMALCGPRSHAVFHMTSPLSFGTWWCCRPELPFEAAAVLSGSGCFHRWVTGTTVLCGLIASRKMCGCVLCRPRSLTITLFSVTKQSRCLVHRSVRTREVEQHAVRGNIRCELAPYLVLVSICNKG